MSNAKLNLAAAGSRTKGRLMENLLVYIIFFVLLIIGLARRVQEARQEAERRKKQPSEKPSDLPEATRRILYGDEGEAPRERTVGAPAPSRPVQRSFMEDDDEDVTYAPSRRPGPERNIPRQREVKREDSGRWIPEQREMMRGEGQRAMPGQTLPRGKTAPRQEGKAIPEHTPTTQDLSLPGQTTVADTERQLRQGIRPAAGKRRKRGALIRLEDLRDLRKGIVLREILGPPRGLRPFEDRQ